MATRNDIELFLHCGKCMPLKPRDVSPAEWSRTQAGITHEGGIQIWCNRCDVNVALFRQEVLKQGLLDHLLMGCSGCTHDDDHARGRA